MIRVVLVDDDSLVRAGLKFILSSTDDIDVVGEAEDGEAGLVLVNSARPDVVLMDLRMTGMDGRSATAEINKMTNPPYVLALTTFDVDSQVIAVLEAGASGYLLKDTPPLEIIEAIRQTARGGTVLSTRHARVLLNGFAKNSSRGRDQAASARMNKLTNREREVVRAVATGQTNAEIGRSLHCSPATVKAHLANVFATLDVQNRVQLAILAHEAGMLDDSVSP